MEPENSAPIFGPEQAPRENGPERILPPTPERGLLETGAEHTEQKSETSAQVADNSGTPTIVVPTAVPSVATTTDDQTVTAAPVTASDDDLIEKEWVDRAKKIVSDTRDDPFQQENAVSALQKDYLKKRYGRELGEAN